MVNACCWHFQCSLTVFVMAQTRHWRGSGLHKRKGMHVFRRLAVYVSAQFQSHIMTSFLAFPLQNAAMLSGDAAGSDAVSEDQRHPATHPQEVHEQLQLAQLTAHAHLPPSPAVPQGKQPAQTLTGQAPLPCASAGAHRGSPTPTQKARGQSMPLDLRLQKQTRSPSPKRPRRVPATKPQVSDPAPGLLAHGQSTLSPQQKTGSVPSQACSRRSPSPVSKAQRRLLPALPDEPLSRTATDARQLVSPHSERSEAAPSRSPSPKRQRQSRLCPDDCAHTEAGIPREVLQGPSPASNNFLKALPVFPQHHVRAPSHARLHSLEVPLQIPEEPPEGPSLDLADAQQARPPTHSGRFSIIYLDTHTDHDARYSL